MNENTNKVLDCIDQDPALLEQLLKAEQAPMTRGGQRVNPLLNVLDSNISQEETAAVNKELAENPVVQLYSAAAGSIDAKDLLNAVGGTRGLAGNNNAAVRALFDGKLDIKDIMVIIILLKLLKRKNSNTYSNSAIGLLGTLLGLNNTQQSTGGLFSSLLGGSSYSQPNNLFGSLFGTNSGYNTYYNSNNNSGLGSFLGLTGNSNSNNSSLQSLLNFVNGNYNNNSQYSLLYNILSSAASSIVSDSGNVSASGLFSVLNQLLQS